MVVLLLVSVALMMADHRFGQLERLRATLSVLVYPVQYLVDLPSDVGGWVLDSLASRETLQSENEQLRKEMLLMRAQLQKFAALQSENQRMRRLLMSSQSLGERVRVAELLNVEMDPFSRKIVINKGSNDGVYIGQSLLDASGVVGQITHVGPFSSTALMITDSTHAIPVQVNRTGQRAVANGNGGTELELMHVANSADLEPGDLLVTSGLGGRFPAGYPVARVSRVQRDPSRPFARIRALPLAKIDRLREVMLVWMEPRARSPVPAAPAAPAPTVVPQVQPLKPVAPLRPRAVEAVASPTPTAVQPTPPAGEGQVQE